MAMRLNALVAVLLCVLACYTSYAYPPIYSDEPPVVNGSGGNDDDADGYAMPHFNLANAHLQQQHRVYNNKPLDALKISTSQSLITEAEEISATAAVSPSSLESAFVYSAQVPTHIQPEASKVVNAVKLASSTVAAMPAASSSSTPNGFTGPIDNAEMYVHLSKKPIGSSTPASIAVVLNGNEPEYTDALGQKVPKPLPSLQVASPIDLLNPDRYEFFTFDENGELVKRLMTMEEIQSIVANGDGEGPTIIHHGPVDDRDPEKNVQDIVNSVQDVLNKEVESNKNSSTNILPVLDTPDVSSSWSMILPAIFGNTGGVDILTHQRPQQIVMTPDTEIIDTSTIGPKKSTTKKPRPNKRKPGQKRKPSVTSSTTDVTPQVIQEELESHESVYTGMQQYQHLAATMQNYDGFSQLHMQPIYHKLPEQVQVETTTKTVFINNQEVVQKPLNDDVNLMENPEMKPLAAQHKPVPPHRVKKPNAGSTTTKRPQNTKQKIKRKPTISTTTRPEATTSAEIIPVTPEPSTSTTSSTTSTPPTTTEATSTETVPIDITSAPTTEASLQMTSTTSTMPIVSKKKKKKPTRQPIQSSSTQSNGASNNPHLIEDQHRTYPNPHKSRPTYKPQATTSDLTAEGSSHQEVSQNKYQHVTYHRPRPKPQNPKTSPVPSTTVVISPVPLSTVPTPQEPSLIVEDFPGYLPAHTVVWAKITTDHFKQPITTANVLTNSGTAGYPVPAYSFAAEHNATQHKKQSLPNSPIIHHTVSMPHQEQDEDIHAMQSFDQILQSLKQPEIGADKIDHHIKNFVETPVSPVKYDSAENMDQLEELAKKHMVPVINYMKEGPTANLPLYTHHGINTLLTTLSDLEITTHSTSIVTDESTILLENSTHLVVTTEQPELQVSTTISEGDTTTDIDREETIETKTYNYTPNETVFAIASEIIETTTQSSEANTGTSTEEETTESLPVTEESRFGTEIQTGAQETTTKSPINQHTLIYTDKITTDSVDILEQTSDYLKIQTRLPVTLPHIQDDIMNDDRDSYDQPILVADLKPQLNMEVLKPSEQISMSDFQTHAATVASTLVDGTNTLAVAYNMSSNETKDEIAFLMSDVIKQISNDRAAMVNYDHANFTDKPSSLSNAQIKPLPGQLNYNDNVSKVDRESNPVQASFNDNRYSNYAKLNTTFLSYGDVSAMEGHKPSYERFGDGNLLDVAAMDDYIEYTTLAIETTSATEETTTDLLEAMEDQTILHSNEDSSSLHKLVVTTVSAKHGLNSYEETTIKTHVIDSDTKNYSIGQYSDESSSTSATESDEVNYDTQGELNEPNGQPTALKIPVLFSQQQIENDEREALFETDEIVDTTTTQFSSVSEETTHSQWQIGSDGDIRTDSSENIMNTTVDSAFESITEMEEITDKSLTSADIENTTILPTDKLNISETKNAAIKEESTEGLETISISDILQETTLRYEGHTENSSEESPEDSESNVTDLKPHRSTEIATEESINEEPNGYMKEETFETSTQENITQSSEKDEEETTNTNSQDLNEDMENTTLKYKFSEETSGELNAIISEEGETVELVDEDPYIKLGETTTSKFVEPTTASHFQISKLKLESAEGSNKPVTQSEQGTLSEAAPQRFAEHVTQRAEHILAPTKPIITTVESEVYTNTEVLLQSDDSLQTFEGVDEEDEDDQVGYQTPKLEESFLTTSTSTTTTTTPKPTITTTRRLNTLKPVSYFNKQPAYALFPDTVEPLYNKSPILGQPQQENVTNKVMTYSIPTPQQRPMQRPPQLSNLMIASTQATRAPVKLEPSPTHSKGLEASLANLDQDILSFARLCNELAFSYWKSITSEKISSTRSLVLSPFALTSMLSMVFLGARGSTSGEMNDVLKLDDMVTFNPHLVFKNITESVEKTMDNDIATTAFVREVFSDRANGKILQFFKEKTQQLYSGHVEEVNFHVVNDIIRRRTNLLVKRHTMGKVLEYLRTNSVWVNGPLATISANLFQTDCSQGSTHERDGEIFFQVHPTVRQRRLVPIPAVLFKTGFTAGYEPNLEATVVAFGRIQDTTSMIYVMPGHHSSFSPSDNLDRLEKELMETAISKNAWSNLLMSLMDRPGMEVQLPRFSHRSFVNATLGLQKMGLKGLFKSDFADLGGLTGSSNRDIYLADMIQINTFSTCGEEKIADHHHVEMYPAPPLRKRNKDVDAHQEDDNDSSEAIIDFGSLVQDSALGRGFYDDLLDPKYLELPLPLRPRQARVPDSPRLRFDKPFLYFVRHNPTGMILFMGRFNPRLLP